MALQLSPPSSPRCPWCGSAYRSSYFDRDCSCPACGQSLAVGTAKPRDARLARYVYAAAGLLLFVGIAGFGLKSLPRQPIAGSMPAFTPLSDAVPPFIPTAEFQNAAAEKARLLEQDLARAPDDPFLLATTGETYLYRALADLQVSKDGAAARKSLRHASHYVDQLQKYVPFASFRLRDTIRRFPNLRFSTMGAPSITMSLWRLQAGRTTLFSVPPTGGIPFIRRRRDVTGLPPADPALQGSAASGPGPFPGPPGNGPSGMPHFPGAAPGAAPAPVFPAYPGGNAPMLNLPEASSRPFPLGSTGSPEAAVPDEAERLTQLRQQLTRQPDDPYVIDRLASELLRQSAVYQPAAASSEIQRQARARIDEAARIYTRAGGTARLRLHRAAFYSAAADCRRRLEQWEDQDALLKQAAKEAPYAVGVWHDLKTSALRLGKLDESLAAGKNEARWRFPGIEPDLAEGEPNRQR